MSELMEIKDFIQRIAQGITFAIGIDTQVIDRELKRVAGTVFKPIPQNGGIVKTVMETGEYSFDTVQKDSGACLQCNLRESCRERGYIHCPIIYDNRIVGTMGLICYEDEQIDKINDEKRGLLNFMQSMCELIALKLKEEEVRRKEQDLYEKLDQQNQILNQVLDQISDGYVLLDSNHAISNVNKKALKIFQLDQAQVLGKNILELIPDPIFHDMLLHDTTNVYEKIQILRKSCGVLIYKIADGTQELARIINFKTIENLGSRVAGEAFLETAITFDQILGKSEQMTRLKKTARKVAKTMPNILLTGETGTGKEMFARAIHNESDRCGNPFVPVNCAAIPMELLESELFGYEEGAFTGAKKGGKIGKFELANTGTIFLDEIGDMPFHLQAKLLRVLQERRLERIGGNRLLALDIRIISATNQDLEAMVQEGKFREDLYYRLNIFQIHLPPLRERPEDIPLLVHYFLNKYRSFFSIQVEGLDSQSMEYLCRHPWKGNIRELENVVQYMISMSTDSSTGIMNIHALPTQILEEKPPLELISHPQEKQKIKEIEISMILEALNQYGHSTEGKRLAAKKLGISLATLYRKLGRL